MSNIKSLKQRVKSTIAVTKITKVVQLIAAAKLRPARAILENSTSFLGQMSSNVRLIGKLLQCSNNRFSIIKKLFSEVGNKSYISGLLLSKSFPEEGLAEHMVVKGRNINGENGKEESEGIERNNAEYEISQSHKESRFKHIVIFAFGSQRGLCGPLNSSIAKILKLHVREMVHKGLDAEDGKTPKITVVCIGKKIHSLIKEIESEHVKIIAKPEWYTDKISNNKVKEIASQMARLMVELGVSQCFLIYQNFITTLKQEIAYVELLKCIELLLGEKPDEVPEEIAKSIEKLSRPAVTSLGSGGDFLIDGDIVQIVSSTLERFFFSLIGYVLASSVASENALRMTSMDSATKNGQELAHRLELESNKMRQSSITSELTDLIGGTSASL